MAKPPVTRKPPAAPPSSPIATQAIREMSNFLDEMGLVEGTISIKGGKKTLKGKTENGQAVNFSIQNSGTGFREQTISVCEVLSIPDRRAEAKRLKAAGLSQTEIAGKLGVSQKTISDDLAS